jgi:hypothetical protein
MKLGAQKNTLGEEDMIVSSVPKLDTSTSDDIYRDNTPSVRNYPAF